MVFLSPTWWLRKSSAGNKATCNHLFNSKSIMFSSILGSVWTDNPAYIPISYGGSDESLTDDDAKPSGFTRWLCPSQLRDVTLKINENGINNGFQIWLAEDGPVQNDSDPEFDGPLLRKKIFTIPINTDEGYKTIWMNTDLTEDMYSGHSYGWYFLLDEPEPTLPTSGSLSVVIAASIYFGGGGT